jgi:hypothetical protein
VATPWDQALANRVPLDLGAVAGPTLDAKLAMAEVVLDGADRAYRARRGLPEEEAEYSGTGDRGPAEPQRWLSEPRPSAAAPDSPDAEPDTPDVRIIGARIESDSPADVLDSPDTEPDIPYVRIIPAQSAAHGTADGPVTAAAGPSSPDAEPDTPDVRIIPARTESDSTDTEPTVLKTAVAHHALSCVTCADARVALSLPGCCGSCGPRRS